MASRSLERAGAAPLWSQLQDDLLGRIHRGDFAAAFPGELALVEEYAVSRNTVRQALAQLRADGVVTAARGRAPRVVDGPARPEISQPVGTGSTLFDVVERTGRTQTSVVRALERTTDGVVATRLGLEESTPLLHLERLRHADDEPLAWDRVWLPFAAAAPLLGVDLTHTALHRALVRHTGLRVDGGRERIHAELADPVRARLLGIAPGDAVLAMERTGYQRGLPVEWRRTVVRGDRFSLTAVFGPEQGRELAPATDRTDRTPVPA
ncbi:GntR family transcriptional regulator [Actinomycetospora sp. TBRC 11914]|uniref:GntR family transcriptional regulator n=1 Tax=Actinomycetospora sp. TBRC 11914 TaxID=2729387 RepID=UPI00145C80D1|nr:GntR family transcriptional regulator [Actinomycetospora sp. TBRC 11914]NMO88394.1 GntR family transcriptional regulator [Actinomycetospora sp. TBRC 11914]